MKMKRNYGVDFLRILSMFMVVVLHVLGNGGVLAAAEPNSLKYWMAWLLEISCYCAVDCFALISGYVMWRSSAKLSKALNLWLQTFFYTALALVLFLIFMPEAVGLRSIANAIFPITRNHYWYISVYFGLMVLSPLLNTIIVHAEKKVLGVVLLLAWALFSALPHALMSDPYALSGGYSLIWLALLYLAGGFISKYSIADMIKKSWAWLTITVMISLTFLSKFILRNFPQTILPTQAFSDMFITYASPSIVLIGVAWLILCSKFSFGKRATKCISILAPASLGVYLVHVNQLVWDNLFAGSFARFVEYNIIVMILLILASAVVIYVACTVIELIRIQLFKLLKIDKLCSAIETRVTDLFQKYSKV